MPSSKRVGDPTPRMTEATRECRGLIEATTLTSAKVLDALMKAARARGDHEVLLHAQTSAAPFYLRAGFAPRGVEFEEAGIPHVEMVRVL